MKRKSNAMKNCWMPTVLLISLLFVGCRPMQMVGGSTSQVSERETASRQTDNVFIYVYDSVTIRENGDTVWQDRWHTEYRDRWHERTDTVTIRDSIGVEKPVLVEKPLSGWMNFQLWAGRLALIALLALVAWKVLKLYLKTI